MLDIVIYTITIILSLVGLVEIIRYAALALLSEKNAPEQMMMVLLNDTNAEAALRSAVEQIRLAGNRGCRRIIAVDTGLSDHSAEICRKFCDDCECIVLCSQESLNELINSISSQNNLEL